MTSEQQRQIVVPGDHLPDDVQARDPYITQVSGRKLATVIGLLDRKDDSVSFIPLQGVYVPKPGDVIIGLVASHGILNWYLDINSPYKAVLTAQDFLGRPYNPATDDLSKVLRVGEYVKCKVVAFDRTRDPLVTVQGEGLGKIVEGKVVDILPARVPRVIGRRHSMINMLKEETGCDIFVAVNGRVHVKCDSEELEAIVILAIKMIEREAHTTGLTERVRKFIREERTVRGV